MTALGYTLGVFALILLLSRLKLPLSLAILLGTIAIGLLFGQGPGELAGALLSGAIGPMAVGMVLITAVQLMLSESMRLSGQLQRIVDLTRLVLRRPRIALAALPALIGLLPMPGGALFSAPMVESAAAGEKIDGGRLSAINYWYRHIWEHWWPLYPGVILAMSLTASPPGVFMAWQFPLWVFMIVSGLWVFRGVRLSRRPASAEAPPGTRRRLLVATSSIWVILIFWPLTAIALSAVPHGAMPEYLQTLADKFIPITVGMTVSMIWTARMNRFPLAGLGRILVSGPVLKLLALVAAVMVFQFVLERVGAAGQIGQELRRLHMPVTLVMVVLPFIAGMVTGLAVGFVGTSFPIVLALIAGLPGDQMRPYVALAYAAGHLGMMLSPLHVCQVVSNEYFKTSYGPVYRRILPAVITMAVLVAGYFAVLRIVTR